MILPRPARSLSRRGRSVVRGRRRIAGAGGQRTSGRRPGSAPPPVPPACPTGTS